MAKKRKAVGQPFGSVDAKEAASENTKLSIKTFEDVADSEDEFHVNRDKILLDEGPAQRKRRRLQEEEQFLEPSDEEVLAESDSASSSADEFEDAEEEPAIAAKSGKDGRSRAAVQDFDDDASAALEDDEDAQGWGTSKQDYYNADVIETEADALEEEAEARRLQEKQLQDMTEADFGFDEVDWLEAGKDDGEEGNDEDGVHREVLPKLEITDAMGPEERMKILRTRYPEFEPLAKEFLDLQSLHRDLRDASQEAITASNVDLLEGELDDTEPATAVATLKFRALSAYLGSLSMYFALLTSGAASSNGKSTAMPPEELREHTVMETLVQCRDLWERIKDIPLPDLASQRINTSNATKSKQNVEKEGPAEDELLPQSATKNHTSKHADKRARKAERLALASQAEAEARRQERLRKTEVSLAGLSVLTNPSGSKAIISRHKPSTGDDEDSNSDFGDATSLTAHEAAEKAQRKKSLKFYTSQIAQKSNKRDNAGRGAGGDEDLPHRERLRDRQERLNAEAEKRGKKPKESGKGVPLGEGSGDEGEELSNAQRKENGAVADSDDEYYDLVAKRASDKKASKAANAAKAQAAELVALGAANPNAIALDADGKRAITYAIEKNKGLTPHRKKDVRNPRVKKRKKYEEKKKKLGSIRAVYKGDREGKGGYGGEKTGIKRGLVRSVKL